MKKCALAVSFALVVLFIIAGVSAADDADANLTASASDSDILSANTTGVQDASFAKVSKQNYVVGDSFDVKLQYKNGSGISNKSVYFTVQDNVSEVITDNGGVAKFALNLTKGYYTIKFNFNDTDFKPISGSKKILILSKPVSNLKASNMNAYAGIKKTFKVTLTADGIPISGRKVTFTVNKKNYVKKTDSKGVAALTIYMSKGKYTIKYSYAGEENIKSSKGSSKLTIKNIKNPYGTKYRTVLIDADGGFTKAFLKDVAKKLRKAGWKVIVKGIGPGQHSINYKKVKNAVYMPFYNGLCAATIKEMTYGYYGGVLKKNKAVITPAWYTDDWVSAKMSKFRNDITNFGYLKRAWDDNFSPKSFKGINNPAKFMTDNGIKYCIGDTTYKIVEQFLYGGWVAHH